MVKGDVIIRINCLDRDSWLKLIKKGGVNAIDLCLDIYTSREIEELNKIFESNNKVLIAYATPIINVAFLISGRILAIFKELQELEINMLLNNKLLSYIRTFIGSKNFKIELIKQQIEKIIETLINKQINLHVNVQEHKDNSVVVGGKGVTYNNELKELEYKIQFDATKNIVALSTSSIIEMLGLEAIAMNGFKDFLSIGKVEGLYTIYISKLIERKVIDIKELYSQ